MKIDIFKRIKGKYVEFDGGENENNRIAVNHPEKHRLIFFSTKEAKEILEELRQILGQIEK